MLIAALTDRLERFPRKPPVPTAHAATAIGQRKRVSVSRYSRGWTKSIRYRQPAGMLADERCDRVIVLETHHLETARRFGGLRPGALRRNREAVRILRMKKQNADRT